jgi:dolichol kinase
LSDPSLSLLALGIGTLAFGIALGAVSIRLERGDGSRRSLGRKTFHIAVFTGAVPAQLWLGFWGVVLYGVVLALLVAQGLLRGTGSSFFRALAREGDGEGKARLVLLPLLMTALGGLLGVLLVGRFAIVGYLVCGWGDAAGELVGGVWGRRGYSPPFSRGAPPSRTVEGSLAVLVAGFLGAWAALDLLGYPPRFALGIGVLCGLVGALSEGLSGRGTDNLWVQLLPSLTAWWFLG